MQPTKERLVVVWRVTQNCDLGCSYCGYSRALPRPRADADPEAVARWAKVLGDYALRTGRDVLVSWLGGEPLRWPPWLDLSRLFRRDYGLTVGVTTNGTALGSEAVRRSLAADFAVVTVSLDGPAALHDALRHAPGLYERLYANIQKLRELKEQERSGLHLRVNTVLMRDNIYEFEALCQTAAEWGFESLTFNSLGGRDRPEFHATHHLQPGHAAWLREALPGIRERAARLGLQVMGSDSYLERLTAWAAGQPISVGADDHNPCRAGENFLFVDEQGWVSPCSFTAATYGYSLAGLQTPEALASLPQRWAQDRRGRLAPSCADCPSTQVFGKFWYPYPGSTSLPCSHAERSEASRLEKRDPSALGNTPQGDKS